MTESCLRIPSTQLHKLAAALFEKSNTSLQHADLMARLLVETDLRGVFSHGTKQIPGYVRMMREGRVNPRPTVRVVRETRTTQVLDGDGGMGHIPCYEGTHWAVERAKEFGTAAVTTCNHFHFGGAGKYTRIALEHDCIGLAVSSHRLALDPKDSVQSASGGSPISLGFPAGDGPTLVLDTGATFIDWDAAHFERDPWPFFKSLGLGAALQALGGILPGIYKPQFQAPPSPWESNQGAFIAVYDVGCFMSVDEFKREMDRYMRQARDMVPLPGLERGELGGSVEWQRQRDYARDGIPMTTAHRQTLEEISEELGVAAPFAAYEHTRFDLDMSMF
jgi:LDH2 family malate/lactate/ureidoglycolate dehydrogenase